jgi:hypothetical protein
VKIGSLREARHGGGGSRPRHALYLRMCRGGFYAGAECGC